jgi:hypothetical protein
MPKAEGCTARLADSTTPHNLVLGVIALCLAVMVAVLVLGLWRSGILTQDLWSDRLARQAAYLLGFAVVTTLGCVLGVPVRSLRGWPSMSIAAALCCVAICGAGAVCAAGLIAASSFVAGHAVFLAAGRSDRPDSMLCVVVGLGAIMLLLVVSGISHLPMLPAFWLALAISAAPLLSRRLRDAVVRSLFRTAADAGHWRMPRIGCACLILFALLFYMFQAAMPERFWDPLAAHLLIPTQVAVFGRWDYDPSQFAFAFFPMAVDYLFAFGFALGGEGATRLINVLAMVGILLLVVDIVRSCCAGRYAEPAALLVLSLPIAMLSTASAMVENVLCLLILGAIRAILLMDETPQRAPMVALCILLPAMVAVKLHGVIAALPCAAIVLMRLRYRALNRSDWLAIGTSSLLAAAAGMSQYLYAWYATGNPIFPLMNDLFRSPLWPVEAFDDPRWQGHLSWDLLYQMTFHSSTFLEAYPGAMGFVFLALLLPGVVATVLVPRTAPIVALIVAGFYAAVVLIPLQYIRYLYPVMPLLLVPCMHALSVLGNRTWGRMMGCTVAAAVAVLGILVLPSGAWTLRAADLSAVYDPAARQQMLIEQAPTRLMTEAVNAIGSGLPRVIYGGEPYGALLRGTPIYTVWYNRAMNTALRHATDASAVTAVLDAQRPDFVVAQPESTDKSERRVAAYAEHHGTRIATIGSVALWRIAPLH